MQSRPVSSPGRAPQPWQATVRPLAIGRCSGDALEMRSRVSFLRGARFADRQELEANFFVWLMRNALGQETSKALEIGDHAPAVPFILSSPRIVDSCNRPRNRWRPPPACPRLDWSPTGSSGAQHARTSTPHITHAQRLQGSSLYPPDAHLRAHTNQLLSCLCWQPGYSDTSCTAISA